MMQLDRRRSEAGDTLVEILVAMVLLSIGAVALMGMLASTIAGSAEHRSLATIDTVLRSSAETLKYDVQLRSNPLFTPCATVTSTSYASTTINFNAPSGYQVTMSGAPLGGAIEYWNPTAGALSASCSATWSDKAGFQLVYLTVTGPHATSETMAVGLRSPT